MPPTVYRVIPACATTERPGSMTMNGTGSPHLAARAFTAPATSRIYSPQAFG